jgi:hypothetical protein
MPRTTEARDKLEPLYDMATKSRSWRDNPETFPEEACVRFREWLETFFTPEAWTRYQAARRQRKVSRKKHSDYERRETTVALKSHPSYELGELAKELGIDKKELLNKLPSWFMWDDKGKAAFQAFGTSVRVEQRAKGLKLLEEVFPLAAHEVKLVVFQAVGLDPVRERELHRFAHLAGKPRLTKLSKVLRAQAPRDQLNTLVTVKHQDKLLLELAATGGMATALKALGVSGEAGPLDEEVIPLY